jgi:hypothetical protein
VIGARVRNFRKSEAAQRTAERRRREDEAPRLKAEVPALETLALEISDSKGAADPASTYVRRVQVASAPALFEIPCADSSCKDGGHELTHAVMRALRDHRTSFDGEDVCHGSVGTATCGRVLRYVATATFQRA